MTKEEGGERRRGENENNERERGREREEKRAWRRDRILTVQNGCWKIY